MDFTIWNDATGSIEETGTCVYGAKALADRQRIWWGDKFDFAEIVFDTETGEPVSRQTPPQRDQRELSIAANRERQRRIEAGKMIDGVHVTGSDRDQVNLIALKDTARDLAAAGVSAAIIPFRDGANVEHMLTPAQMMAIADAGKVYVTAIYQASWALKAMTPIPQDVENDQYWP